MKAELPTKVKKLLSEFLESPGSMPREARRAIVGRAAQLGGGEGAGEVGEKCRGYVEKVAREAHRITDADIADLKASGYTEDQIFEITVGAALGAGRARMERGLLALKGSR